MLSDDRSAAPASAPGKGKGGKGGKGGKISNPPLGGKGGRGKGGGGRGGGGRGNSAGDTDASNGHASVPQVCVRAILTMYAAASCLSRLSLELRGRNPWPMAQ